MSKPRPGNVPKGVLRKVPVPNGVPRKVPKKRFGSLRLYYFIQRRGPGSTFSALSSAPHLEPALSEALLSALFLVGALARTSLDGRHSRKSCSRLNDFGSNGKSPAILSKHFLSLPLRSENSRRLWLFLGSLRGFPRKTPRKSQENCWKNFSGIAKCYKF